jgi:hypothetical protein
MLRPMDTLESREQALRMLDTFASVGANRFDASRIDMDRRIIASRPDLSITELKRLLPAVMESAGRERHNIVIRPRSGDTVALIQLDDLDSVALDRVQSVAFMALATSRASNQAWVALQAMQDRHKTAGHAGAARDIARRFRKGTGADPNASSAVRIAGSRNFKPKYAPDFPTVTLIDIAPGRIVSPADIAPFLVPEEPRTWVQRVTASRPRRWPDYERELQKAPPNHAGTAPDRSVADWNWSLIAAS